jgi:4'-phosphopantetheinyl transferase
MPWRPPRRVSLLSISAAASLASEGTAVGLQLLWPPASQLEPLRAAEVHVWGAATDVPGARHSDLEKWLSSDERERAARFHNSVHARRWGAARGMLRELLARYVDAEPPALRFAYDAHGRPSLAEPTTSFPLSFNVSHSAALAVYAFSAAVVGVDAEQVVELPDLREIQKHCFSPAERAALDLLDHPAYTAGFFRCWTRKEAYLKTRGLGLSARLDSFDVSIAAVERPALLRVQDDPEVPRRWSLHHLVPAHGFVGAVATPVPDSRLHCRSWVP